LPERRFNSPKTSRTERRFLRFHWGMMERLCPWCNRPSRSRSLLDGCYAWHSYCPKVLVASCRRIWQNVSQTLFFE
jgi:hypothetical protein